MTHSLADLKRVRELGSTSTQETKSGWKSLIALALGLGAVVLEALSGMNAPLRQDE